MHKEVEVHTIVAGGGSSLYEERRRSEKLDSRRELSALFRVPASLFPLLFPFVPFIPYTLQLYENVRKTAFFPKKKQIPHDSPYFSLWRICAARSEKYRSCLYSVVDVLFLKYLYY
jgi:hypothetical protein